MFGFTVVYMYRYVLRIYSFFFLQQNYTLHFVYKHSKNYAICVSVNEKTWMRRMRHIVNGADDVCACLLTQTLAAAPNKNLKKRKVLKNEVADECIKGSDIAEII